MIPVLVVGVRIESWGVGFLKLVKSVILAGLLLLQLSLPAPSAAQQNAGVADLEAAVDRAFQEMLADPANLDKAFAYAELAILIEDFEGAISTLERMLLYNPNLPRVRLELGVLYFRLGSFATARSYLQRVLDGNDVPDAVRVRVDAYLEQIEEQVARHRFFGTIYGGMRYQTNANAGPQGNTVTIVGVTGFLDDTFTEHSDWNAFLSGSFHYTYDPHLESGEVLESDLLAYGAKYRDQDQLDLMYFEVKTGPRAPFLSDSFENMTIRPYVLVDYAWLEDATYFGGGGGGITFAKQFGPKWHASITPEHRFRRHNNTNSRPTNEQLDGARTGVAMEVRYGPTRNSLIRAKAEIAEEDLDKDFNSNLEIFLSLAFTLNYDAPLGVTRGKWSSTIVGSVRDTNYDSADPFIDPTRKRGDREWKLGFTTVMPITDAWSIVGTLQRTHVSSNFENFTYDNWEALIGGSFSF